MTAPYRARNKREAWALAVKEAAGILATLPDAWAFDENFASEAEYRRFLAAWMDLAEELHRRAERLMPPMDK
jgi:hypothetical protein